MLLEGRYSGYILNRCGFLKVKSKFFVNVCKGENENKFFFWGLIAGFFLIKKKSLFADLS